MVKNESGIGHGGEPGRSEVDPKELDNEMRKAWESRVGRGNLWIVSEDINVEMPGELPTPGSLGVKPVNYGSYKGVDFIAYPAVVRHYVGGGEGSSADEVDIAYGFYGRESGYPPGDVSKQYRWSVVQCADKETARKTQEKSAQHKESMDKGLQERQQQAEERESIAQRQRELLQRIEEMNKVVNVRDLSTLKKELDVVATRHSAGSLDGIESQLDEIDSTIIAERRQLNKEYERLLDVIQSGVSGLSGDIRDEIERIREEIRREAPGASYKVEHKQAIEKLRVIEQEFWKHSNLSRWDDNDKVKQTIEQLKVLYERLEAMREEIRGYIDDPSNLTAIAPIEIPRAEESTEEEPEPEPESRKELLTPQLAEEMLRQVNSLKAIYAVAKRVVGEKMGAKGADKVGAKIDNIMREVDLDSITEQLENEDNLDKDVSADLQKIEETWLKVISFAEKNLKKLMDNYDETWADKLRSLPDIVNTAVEEDEVAGEIIDGDDETKEDLRKRVWDKIDYQKITLQFMNSE
ncbi:MAG: hypothetical protein ABII72_00060, partial [Parcubacteria group bacterium]